MRWAAVLFGGGVFKWGGIHRSKCSLFSSFFDRNKHWPAFYLHWLPVEFGFQFFSISIFFFFFFGIFGISFVVLAK